MLQGVKYIYIIDLISVCRIVSGQGYNSACFDNLSHCVKLFVSSFGCTNSLHITSKFSKRKSDFVSLKVLNIT